MEHTIKVLKEEIQNKQREQVECVDRSGYVKDRNTWNRLMNEISAFQDTIKILEQIDEHGRILGKDTPQTPSK